MDPDQKLLQDQGHPGQNGEISFVTKTLGEEEGGTEIEKVSAGKVVAILSPWGC